MDIYTGLSYLDELTPQLQIDFAKKRTFMAPEGKPQEPNLPFGRYTLTKQS